MLYGFRADIAPINSSLFIRFEIGSNNFLVKFHAKFGFNGLILALNQIPKGM